jgi:sucrose-6-phosphate hydrolase SacC (GH32 family)
MLTFRTGPDYYASAAYNGLAIDDRTAIGWMNNWQYAGIIPTNPWRSAMSIPRGLSLATINNRVTLMQTPEEKWSALERASSTSITSWNIFPNSTQKLGFDGKSLDITLSFSDRMPAAGTSPTFGIILRATSDLSQQTIVGYDFVTKQLFVDRGRSGDVTFDSTFASVYHAPLAANQNGKINMRIFLDWSSVEVFGGDGEVTLTAQIFPADNGTAAMMFSTEGATKNVKVTAKMVGSSWN